MTESRAVSTMTGTGTPGRAAARSTSKPSMPGQPDVEHHQVEVAAERLVEPLAAVAGDRGAGSPSARSPLATNDAIRGSSSTIRMRATGPPRCPGRGIGQGDHEPRAGRDGVLHGRPCRRGPRAMARTIDRPEAEALVALGHARCGRTARRSARRSAGGHPGPGVADPEPRHVPSYDDPIATTSPGPVCFTALSASWSTRLGDPLLVDHRPWPRRCASSLQSRSPRPRALASRSSVRPAEVDRAGW